MIVRVLRSAHNRSALNRFYRVSATALRTAIVVSVLTTLTSVANGLTVDIPPLAFVGASQFGSRHHDYSFSLVLADDGSLYSGGGTLGSIAGPNANGFSDILLTRLQSNGDVRWHRQISANDLGSDTVNEIDLAPNGDILIAATTSRGILTPITGGDAFVARYSPSGDLVWQRQFGTNSNDIANGIAVSDDGNSFIGGYTNGALINQSFGDADAYISMLDSAGEIAWIKQFGSDRDDRVRDVATATDGGVVAVGRYNERNLPGGFYKAFITKYDNRGEREWFREFTVNDVNRTHAYKVMIDAQDNIYLAGEVNIQSNEVFVQKYNPDGEMLWETTFGTDSADFVSALAIDSQGGVFLAGNTQGDFNEQDNGFSGYIARIDPAGSFDWAMHFGVGQGVSIEGLALGDGGLLYLSGHTGGVVGPRSFGQNDIFLARFVVTAAVPEPASSVVLATMFVAGTLIWHRRSSRKENQ